MSLFVFPSTNKHANMTRYPSPKRIIIDQETQG